jgi:lysozyme
MATPDSVMLPNVPDNLIDQIRRDEGYTRLPMRDTRGNLFIGYGFDLETVGLNPTECFLVLTHRLSELKTELVKTLPWVGAIDAVRQDAITNMAYNLGIDDLRKFNTFLALAEAGNWEGAANDLSQTAWAQEVGSRAHRLQVQLRTGVRQ